MHLVGGPPMRTQRVGIIALFVGFFGPDESGGVRRFVVCCEEKHHSAFEMV